MACQRSKTCTPIVDTRSSLAPVVTTVASTMDTAFVPAIQWITLSNDNQEEARRQRNTYREREKKKTGKALAGERRASKLLDKRDVPACPKRVNLIGKICRQIQKRGTLSRVQGEEEVGPVIYPSRSNRRWVSNKPCV